MSKLAGIGGGETILINLIKGLDSSCFEKFVICPQNSKFTDAIKDDAKIYIISYGHPLKEMYGNVLKIAIFMVAFYKFLKKYQIDIVHTNDVVSTFYVAPVAKMLRIPVVMTSHGWWDSTPIRNWFYHGFVNKILCVSKFVRDSYLKNGPGHKLPLEVVHLGVDANKFRSDLNTDYLFKEFGFNKTIKVISIIGRFQKIKGHNFFLEAAEIVLRERQDIKFLIIGSNQFNIKDDEINFQQMVNKVEGSEILRNHVVFTGFRSDIPEIINFSKIVVNSSICETFGMTIVEAMACSKPVISTNMGSPPEIIEDGINGFLIPTQNSIAIAEKIILLLENPSLSKNIGREARKSVEENFSLDSYVEKIKNIYRNLVQQGNN